MSDTDAPNTHDDSGEPAGSPLGKLTPAQVFAKDPEEYTREDLDVLIEELRKINARHRKAREDEAALAEATAKIKKANAATRKKKATAPASMDTSI